MCGEPVDEKSSPPACEQSDAADPEPNGMAHRELDQARLRGAQLVARTVAHRINNSISPIVGFAELLRQCPSVADDPAAAVYVKLIEDAAHDTTSLVRRLQGITRLEEDQTLLGPELPLLDLERSSVAE
jgi:signal transduction histidine kinase